MDGLQFVGVVVPFRFLALLIILTAVALCNLALEKRQLSLKQKISALHFELDELDERRARLFLTTQQLGAPIQLYADSVGHDAVQSVQQPVSRPDLRPLLEWKILQSAEGR